MKKKNRFMGKFKPNKGVKLKIFFQITQTKIKY